MKTHLTVSLAMMLAGATAITAFADAPQRPAHPIDPFHARSVVATRPGSHPLTSIRLRPHDDALRPVRKTLRQAQATPVVDVIYSGAFQSYYEDYEFNADGGEYLCYDVSVTIEGTTAVIYNLFNLEQGYPYESNEELDITGTYDPATRTVTIPTARQFDMATIAGYGQGSVPLVILSGHLNTSDALETTPELKFQLSEDGTRLATTQDFGLMQYSPEGSAQGFKCLYKGGVMLETEKASELICLVDKLTLGQCYAGESASAWFNVFNLSDSSSTIELKTDSEAFTAQKRSVPAPSLNQVTLTVDFHPETTGLHNSTLTLVCGETTHHIKLSGECIAPIDYSPIIREGDLHVTTGSKHPFEIRDIGGRPAAVSTVVAETGSESYMTVSFSVPEGQLGTLSWEGLSSSEAAYASKPSLEIDGKETASWEGLLDYNISDAHYFAPGYHTVTFRYEVTWPSFFSESDRIEITDLSLSLAPIDSSKAILDSETLTIPNSLLTDTSTTKREVVTLTNLGSEPLKVIGVESADHFKIYTTTKEARLLDTLEIPVTFTADAAGEYTETVRIATTAGDFEVACRALVREWPDFPSIVKKGDFTFSTDEQNPWLVKDGKAYNSTSKVVDTEVTYCTLQADFEVPKGHLGKLSWKGRLSTAGMVDGRWTDILMISISSSLGTKITIVPGEYDLDTAYFPYFDEANMNDLLCGPGECSVSFSYVQYGDASYGADDLVEIYDLSLDLLDHQGASAVLDREEVTFKEIYAGKSAETNVRLLNTGVEPLMIYSVEGDRNFSGVFQEMEAQYNQSLDIKLYFDPREAGHYESDVIIVTTAGEFTVHCIGDAMSTDGMLLIEDFEDDGAGWSIYDRDGDGDGWNLAWNVYGGLPQGHVHSGEECLVSFSWDYISGTFHPDNWTFSPSFEVPESGAWLTWWSAGDDNARPGDVYSVYVGHDTPLVGETFDMDSYKCVYTETIVDDTWKYHCVDISEFKGETVHVAFRHYDCSGCYMVKIDDVFVYDHDPGNGVTSLHAGTEVVGTLYHTPDGVRLTAPARTRGIVIATDILSDGSRRTRKQIRR